jgi:hypothetical protein
MKNVGNKYVEKSKHTFYVQKLFSKIEPFIKNVGKYCRAGQATGDNIAHEHGMLDT